MGLAGTKVKQRFGTDPRNTQWSNDTDRFGHQYLEKLGWKPGKGLGLVEHAMTAHVKVSIKADNAGLGAKLAKKRKNDEFDTGECAGLDAFQRILGRLNGKESQINDELERQRKESIINGKWGMHFVKGDTLQSTWDAECKELLKGEKRKAEESEAPRKKSKKSSSDEESESDSKKSKSSKKDKKLEKEKKEKKEKKDKKSKSEDKEKSSKKEKSKKDKSSKKEKSKKDKSDSDKESSKKSKKSKKSKYSENAEEEVTRESMLKPRDNSNKEIATRLSARAKWIRQKRASVMDSKALNEIFMIAN